MSSTYDPHFDTHPSTTDNPYGLPGFPVYPRLDPYYLFREGIIPPEMKKMPRLDVRDEWLTFVKIALDMYGVELEYCAGCGRSRHEYYQHTAQCPLRPARTGKYRESAYEEVAMRADDV